jgi:peptidylprolyl isomerase
VGVKEGNKIKVEYTGSLDDGTVFDSSEKHGQPLEFEVGKKQVIPGFEKAVIGMKKGEEKEVKINAADAYGEPNPEAVQKVPKEKMPTRQELKEGMLLVMNLPNGMKVPAKIVKVEDKEVTIDFNHPLAGKDLNFKIKVVEISS